MATWFHPMAGARAATGGLAVGLACALACGGLPTDLAQAPATTAPDPAVALPIPGGQIYYFDRDSQPDVRFDMDLAVRFMEDRAVAVAEIEATHHGRFEQVGGADTPTLRVTGWERVQGIDGPIEPYLPADLAFTVIERGGALELADGRRFVAVPTAPIEFREPE